MCMGIYIDFKLEVADEGGVKVVLGSQGNVCVSAPPPPHKPNKTDDFPCSSFLSFSEAGFVHLSLKDGGLEVSARLPPSSPMSLIQNKLSK